MALLALGPVGSLAAAPSIEATGTSLATYAWTPSTAEVDAGESVGFKNPTVSLHGLAWESGPETPACTGAPSVGQGNWSGSCSFAQGGTYGFYCPVHPAQMKGTVKVDGPAAPLVTTSGANGVSETAATLNGTVNPSGQATTYFFEYGTTLAYGQKTPATAVGEGTASLARSAPISGLAPSTNYHFRIAAENATGTSHGAGRTFQTLGPVPPPPPPPLEPPPAPPTPPTPTASTSPAPVIGVPPASRPETSITLKPRKRTPDRTPTLKFTATVPGASFRCSVDGKPYKACRSPYTAPALKPGPHTIRIVAVAGGATDPTPAVCRFKVLAAGK